MHGDDTNLEVIIREEEDDERYKNHVAPQIITTHRVLARIAVSGEIVVAAVFAKYKSSFS